MANAISVLKWLLAETGWGKDVALWLAAENQWYFELAAVAWGELYVANRRCVWKPGLVCEAYSG